MARVSPKQLLECCLRMKPDRILLAELRAEEAFDYLRNVNSRASRLDHQRACHQRRTGFRAAGAAGQAERGGTGAVTRRHQGSALPARSTSSFSSISSVTSDSSKRSGTSRHVSIDSRCLEAHLAMLTASTYVCCDPRVARAGAGLRYRAGTDDGGVGPRPRRARQWLLSPVLAAPLTAASGLGMAVAHPVLSGLGLASSGLTQVALGAGMSAALGYVAGRAWGGVAVHDRSHQRGALVRASPQRRTTRPRTSGAEAHVATLTARGPAALGRR